MKKYIVFMLLIISVFSVKPCYAEAKKLTVVFTGDARGELENCHCPKNDFGGLERRFHYVTKARQEAGEILLLDTGDVLPLFSQEFTKRNITYNAFISLKAMDFMGYDVMNAGESDFILGEKFLLEKSKNLKFPIISSNVVYKSTNQPYFKPYSIKTMKNGIKVGILGVTNERYVINSVNLEVTPNKEAVAKYVGELRGQVDVVIVLGHIGLPYSEDLARTVDGIDVILSGHWDSETQEPVRVGKTIIMPSVFHSRKIGRLDMEIESENLISSYEWQSIQLDAKYDGDCFIKKLVVKMPGAIKRDEVINPVDFSEERAKEEKPILVDVENIPIAGKPLRVIVFYAAGCRSCMEVERDILPSIEKKYGEKIAVEKYDISVSRNYAQMVRLEKMYGADGGYVPEIIVSRYVLMGEKEIKSGLDKVIEKALAEPEGVKLNSLSKEDVVAYQDPGLADSLILQRFSSFSAFTVGLAGFLDGLNPCAFTTIVFFISFLAFMGYKKREMFLAGSFFTIAVFMAYFLIGLGIFKFLRSMSIFGNVIFIINIVIGSLAFMLGVLSMMDYFKFRKTHDVKMSILQLPQSIKNRIHSIIGVDFRQDEKVKRKTLLKIAWVAFTSGFTVSVLESVCTGQVYLPTIAYVLRMPDKHMSALAYLLVYNLAFIVPLVIVFVFGFFGATSGAFSRFMQKHFGFVKLSTAILFFVLAAVLVMFK